MFYQKLRVFIAVVIGVSCLSSCSVTTAPTDASSATSGQSTEAFSDVTSSTTLGDDDEDEAKEDEKKVEEFVTANFSQLRSNMSAGGGEYLASLATLLAIDEANKGEFYSLTKNNFSRLFVSYETTPKELVHNLKEELSGAKI